MFIGDQLGGRYDTLYLHGSKGTIALSVTYMDVPSYIAQRFCYPGTVPPKKEEETKVPSQKAMWGIVLNTAKGIGTR